MLLRIVASFILCIFTGLALAENSPVGLWKTMDDKSGKPRSIVRIVEENSVFSGIIEKGLQPGDSPDKVCDKCEPPRKNQRLQGMTFMWGLKKDGDEYKGGEILDPDNGKIYKCKFKLLDDGKKLDVRGFIGISLIGRTQTWYRDSN